MNTANLQMEGLLVALTQLIGALQRKGLLEREEIARALADAEIMARAHADRGGQLREANQNAILFPIRYLMEATLDNARGKTFASITADVGREKDAPSEA
jgi:hypothetical protein